MSNAAGRDQAAGCPDLAERKYLKGAELHEKGQKLAAACHLESACGYLRLFHCSEFERRAKYLGLLVAVLEKEGSHLRLAEIYEERRRVLKRMRAEQDPVYTVNLKSLAAALVEMGKYDEAKARMEECHEVELRTIGREHLDYVKTLRLLAEIHRCMESYACGEDLYEQARGILGRLVGRAHAQYVSLLRDLAQLCSKIPFRVYHCKALQLYRQCCEIQERTVGKENKADYAVTLEALATLYWQLGERDQAEPLLAKCVELRCGAEEVKCGPTMLKYAELCYEMQSYEKAEQLFDKSVVLLRRGLGDEHPDHLAALLKFSRFCRERRCPKKAELLFERCERIQKLSLGQGEGRTYSKTLLEVAALLVVAGCHEKAETLLCWCEALFWKMERGYLATAMRLMNWYLENGSSAKALFLCRRCCYYDDDEEEEEEGSQEESQEKEESEAEDEGLEEEDKVTKMHPEYVATLRRVVSICGNEEGHDVKVVMHCFAELRRLQVKAMGEEHPDYFDSLMKFTSFCHKHQRFATARTLLKVGLRMATEGKNPGQAQETTNHGADKVKGSVEDAVAKPQARVAPSVKRHRDRSNVEMGSLNGEADAEQALPCNKRLREGGA